MKPGVTSVLFHSRIEHFIDESAQNGNGRAGAAATDWIRAATISSRVEKTYVPV